MNKTTAIALKICALYFLFQLIMTLPMLVSSGSVMVVQNDPAGHYRAFFIAMIVFTAILGGIAIVVLWKLANWLAPKVPDESASVPSMDLDKLFTYALAVMGLYFSLNALLALPQQFIMLRWELNMSGGTALDTSYTLSFVMVAVQFVLGAFLVARPRQWVRVIKAIGEVK